MIVIEVLLLAGIGYFGALGPIKKKWWKELIVYLVIFLIGSALLVMQTIGVKIPFIVDELQNYFKYVLHLSYD